MSAPHLPKDKFNQKLIEDVFPAGWKNPKPKKVYDLLVLGGGPGGMTATTVATKRSISVALIEREHLGGECLNVGCIPSKAFLRSCRLAAEIRQAAEFGIEIPDASNVNFSQLMQRVRRLRSTISPHDSAAHFQKLGADVFFGNGRFIGPNELEVGGQKLRFKKAIIASGTQPASLPLPGLKEVGYLTNQSVFNLTTLPERLAVIGGGPIGCELAQGFARLGSQVTIIVRSAHLLPKDDAPASERLKKQLEREGMRILFDCHLERVERKGKEKLLFYKGSSKAVAVDEILVAIGRTPVVEGLGLEKAGVRFDPKTGIKASQYLQTSNRDIYVVSDLEPRYRFTHVSAELALFAVRNALDGHQFKRSSLVIPWCTYTDPEVAHVGLTEQDAQEKGLKIETAMMEMADIDRALLDGETEGFIKIHFEPKKRRILGATLMARHAGEMISELTTAIMAHMTLEDLARVIHPFPTQASVMRKVIENYLAANKIRTAKKKKKAA